MKDHYYSMTGPFVIVRERDRATRRTYSEGDILTVTQDQMQQ